MFFSKVKMKRDVAKEQAEESGGLSVQNRLLTKLESRIRTGKWVSCSSASVSNLSGHTKKPGDSRAQVFLLLIIPAFVFCRRTLSYLSAETGLWLLPVL